MSKILLVSDPASGLVEMSQDGWLSDQVIDMYAADGKRAGFYEMSSLDYGDRFVDRHGKLRDCPAQMLRFDRDVVRANGSDEIRILGVRAGARVMVTDGVITQEAIGDGKTFPLTFRAKGIYKVIVECPPFLPEEKIVRAI